LKVNLPQERISRFHRNLALLRGIGLEIKNYNPGLHVPSEDREYVDSFFSSLTPFPKRPWIAIHPGTSAKTSFKRWMPDRYSQLADRLIHELQATVIFTWGPGELSLVENIQKGMKESSIAGPTTQSLTQLAEVFRRCHLYIGGDTGPMYIASLVGIPLVVVYGPTDPILYEPFGLHRKVMKEVGCNPCYPYRKRSCKKIECLRAIAVEDVFEAAKEMLSISH
jgi:ADP-heptose:LPS heptosyltransferase